MTKDLPTLKANVATKQREAQRAEVEYDAAVRGLEQSLENLQREHGVSSLSAARDLLQETEAARDKALADLEAALDALS